MGRSFWALAGVAVMVAAVGQYVHARSVRQRASERACNLTVPGGSGGATTAPAVVSIAYEDPVNGIRFDRPAGWVVVQPYLKSVVTFRDPKSPGMMLHLDVPVLPAFAKYLPIPVSQVAGDYVKQMNTDIPDNTADPVVDVKAPAADAQRVCCRGHGKDGSPVEDSALLLVHDHRVFIISVDSSFADAPRARAALDAAAGSIQWSR